MSSKVVRQKCLALLLLSFFSGAVVADTNIEPTPSDMALVNEDRIQYWLKKNGEISENSSTEETKKMVNNYIDQSTKLKAQVLEQALPRPYERKGLDSGQQHSATTVNQSVSSKSTTVKVLAILIDFPDFHYDSGEISRNDTSMYYSSYPVSHYKNLMFSTSGYAGPSGKNLRSVYQHYQMASGGTFNFTGTVKGWYRAKSNTDYYGAPNGSANDSRVPELVFEAASQAAASMSAAELAQYDQEDPYDADKDGNYSEPDGIIDHTMVYHSTLGQEAGGGRLGVNAIWSHRYVVQGSGRGKSLPGTTKKVYNYTIQSIDATVGLAAHEFGHELGLKDEYDTSSGSSIVGAPIGYWSIMGQGTWAGVPQGTAPTGFSPLARNELQEKHGGNWVSEQEVEFSAISELGTYHVLSEAANSAQTNQLSITLPLANGESKPRKYLIQLRSRNGIDAGLSSKKYEPGVLIWQHDTNQTNNQVQARVGKPMIGVIDADQNLIGTSRTRVQVRDATFSLYGQSSYQSDTNLNNSSLFLDSADYSAHLKPQAGISLVSHGISVSVVEQATDNTSVRLKLSREGGEGSSVSISNTANSDGSMTFSSFVSGGSDNYTYKWDFGDGNSSSEAIPRHTYAADGSYTVTVTLTDSKNVSISTSIVVAIGVNSDQSDPNGNNDVKSSSNSGGAMNILMIFILFVFRFVVQPSRKRNVKI